jgi:hypothetical protein
VTPAYAVLVLLVVLLVFFPAAALAMWIAGGRLLGREPGRQPFDEDVATLAALDSSGFATTTQIAALSARERLFVTRAIGPRVDAVADAPAPRGGLGAARLVDREVPIAAFILVCPACGASLGTAADIAHYVGSCPACSRRVTSRRRGSRIGFE